MGYQVCVALVLAWDITPAMTENRPCLILSGAVGSFIVVVRGIILRSPLVIASPDLSGRGTPLPSTVPP